MPVQAVLFDMDGTLVDAFKPIVTALNTILDEYGFPGMTPIEVRRHTGRGDGSLAPLFGEQWPAAHKRFLEVHDALYLKQIEPLPGAYELLAWLNEHAMPTGVVTNKTQIRAEAQIAHLGWQLMIGTVVGMDAGRTGKPAPDIVLEACDKLGVDRAQTLLIGDGLADMQAASQAHCRPIALTGTFSDTEMEEHGAERCFSTLDAAHAWLKTQIG